MSGTTCVAIDASAGVSGGGKRYLEELLPRLVAAPGVRLGPMLARRGHVPPALAASSTVVSGRAGAMAPEWRRLVVQSGADVVFAPTEISFARYRVPLVLAARNAMILDRRLLPQLPTHQRRRSQVQRILARRSASFASSYVAVSQYAGRELTESFGVSDSQIQVIYHGGPERCVLPPHPRPVRRILFVSTLHRYKGLHDLLRALAPLSADWSLDVAGDRVDTAYAEELDAFVDSAGLAGRVRFHGWTTGAALQRLYDEADLFVWPSLAETFGHPLVEAHCAGLPIIAARACSNEEIAGSAAHYFRTGAVDELAVLLTEAFVNGLPAGPLPREYDWAVTAQQTIDLLVRVAAMAGHETQSRR